MPEHAQRNELENKSAAAATAEETAVLGDQLHRARKAKGISLAEVSEHTKISKRHLEALEKGEYDILPGETYIIGFLRAYSKYLELDDLEMVREYRREKERKVLQARPESERRNEREVLPPGIWGPLLIIGLLAAAVAGIFMLWPSPKKAEAPVPAGGPSVAPAAFPQAPTLPAALSGDLSLKVKAKAKTWITLMIDGRQEPDVILGAGEERTWLAKERFVLWTGNAGGIEVTFNGELQPPLGNVGEVRKEIIFERQPAAGPAAPAQ